MWSQVIFIAITVVFCVSSASTSINSIKTGLLSNEKNNASMISTKSENKTSFAENIKYVNKTNNATNSKINLNNSGVALKSIQIPIVGNHPTTAQRTLNKNGRSVRALHTSIEDLLKVDRHRRALRFKRNSNYENLMALINAYEDNNNQQVEMDEEKNADQNDIFSYLTDDEQQQVLRDLLQKYGQYEDRFANINEIDGKNGYLDTNEDVQDTESAYDDNNGQAQLTLKDLLDLYAKAEQQQQAREMTMNNYPRYFTHKPSTIFIDSRPRRSGYTYSRFPYGILPGQKRKRYSLDAVTAGGRWGKINNMLGPNQMLKQVESNDDQDESTNRIYTLAAMLANDQGSYRNKRSLSRGRAASIW